MTTHELVPTVSIDAVVMRRDAMVERLTQAHRLLVETDELAVGMFGEEHRGHRLALRNYKTSTEFTSARGLEEAIKEIDGRAWSYLLRESGLATFMDAQARKQWDDAIEKNDVPPLTHATIEATFQAMYAARAEMFERGVVAIFKELSWDYKTHSPVMFGKRVILRHIVDAAMGKSWYGWPSHDGTNRLDDLIRVMSVLDGKPEPDYRHAVYRRMSDARPKFPVECNLIDLGYFTVRAFRNGNGHLTFNRPDLVDKMNQIIARHFPNTLGRSRDAEAEARP